jgi:zinc transport system substrate-binding protein
MLIHRVLTAVLFSTLLVLPLGCGSSTSEQSASNGPARTGPPRVLTVNYPLCYFAERIGGSHVEVVFPAPADVDPAYWMPDAEAIEKFQQADLILLNGAGYAKWRDKVTLPEGKLHDTTAAAHGRLIELEDAVTHTHGPEGEHAHTGLAFTTWLDFDLAVQQVKSVAEALTELQPEKAEDFETERAALAEELAALDTQLKELAARNPDLPLVFSHPVYQYLERRYGLRGKSVHWEPDAAPTDKMWAEFDELLKKHPARWMVWEGEPLAETREKLAERGVECVVFAPCGNRPADGEFLTAMRGNIERLGEALENGSPAQ